MEKILHINYFFPPIINARSIRWVNLIKYLIKDGYKVDVVTCKPSNRIGTHTSNLDYLIPRSVNIHRSFPGLLHYIIHEFSPSYSINSSAIELSLKHLLRRIFNKTIDSLMIPDRTIDWLPFCYYDCCKLMEKNNYNIVISSGLPFTDHIVAYFLKKRFQNLIWIADYGDPWSFFQYPPLPTWKRKINYHIENTSLKITDHIIVTTETTKNGFLKNFSFLEDHKIRVIPQAVDLGLIHKIKPIVSIKFRIVYIGTFYAIRNPFIFFKAIERIKDNGLNLEVIIVGPIQHICRKYVDELNIDNVVKFYGKQPQERALSIAKGASVLLLYGNDSKYQIPGKIYEYFALRRPILNIKKNQKDISEKLINKYRRGITVNDDVNEIAHTVKKLYDLWINNKMNKIFNLGEIDGLDWNARYKKLKQIFHQYRSPSN